jgi:hypothetical protein
MVNVRATRRGWCAPKHGIGCALSSAIAAGKALDRCPLFPDSDSAGQRNDAMCHKPK